MPSARAEGDIRCFSLLYYKNYLNPPLVRDTTFSVTFYGTLCGGGMSGMVLARCKSVAELHGMGLARR